MHVDYLFKRLLDFLFFGLFFFGQSNVVTCSFVFILLHTYLSHDKLLGSC